MASFFQIESADTREQPDTLASLALSQQLAKYQQLRREEKKLRTRVGYLEKQAALKGPLAVEVNLAMLLQEEKAELETLRQTLASQEEQLEHLQSLPVEQRTTIEAEQLEQLVSDLQAKRVQLRIHQDNVNFLEEKQAQYGLDVPLNLANELKLARENLEKLQAQLQTLEKTLKEVWKLDPAQIENLDTMDEPQMRKLALQIVNRIETQEREQAEQRHQAAAEKYEALVLATLEELRKAAYPAPDGHVRRVAHETEWKLSFTGTFGGVSVSLEFDRGGNPVYFRCKRYQHDGRVASEKQADLSRDDLIGALRALHWKEKKWWQWWYKPPALPESWV
jgi:hypothetical protein